MEAYTALKESKASIKAERVTVNRDLPGSMKVSIMKPDESLYNMQEFLHYDVWVQVDTHDKIVEQWSFSTLDEAESKWKEVSGAVERGEYEILLRVDGGDIQIRFTGKGRR